jgi:hypothetical protein
MLLLAACLAVGLLGPATDTATASTASAGSNASADKLTNTRTCQCEEGWIDLSIAGMGCLQFGNTTITGWDNALNYCFDQSAHLLEITTENELQFLQGTMNILEDVVGKRLWWTSATDFGTQGVWIWESSYTEVGEFIWQGNNPGDTGYNCMIIHPSYNYLAYDVPCIASTYYPICQIK